MAHLFTCPAEIRQMIVYEALSSAAISTKTPTDEEQIAYWDPPAWHPLLEGQVWKTLSRLDRSMAAKTYTSLLLSCTLLAGDTMKVVELHPKFYDAEIELFVPGITYALKPYSEEDKALQEINSEHEDENEDSDEEEDDRPACNAWIERIDDPDRLFDQYQTAVFPRMTKLPLRPSSVKSLTIVIRLTDHCIKHPIRQNRGYEEQSDEEFLANRLYDSSSHLWRAFRKHPFKRDTGFQDTLASLFGKSLRTLTFEVRDLQVANISDSINFIVDSFGDIEEFDPLYPLVGDYDEMEFPNYPRALLDHIVSSFTIEGSPHVEGNAHKVKLEQQHTVPLQVKSGFDSLQDIIVELEEWETTRIWLVRETGYYELFEFDFLEDRDTAGEDYDEVGDLREGPD